MSRSTLAPDRIRTDPITETRDQRVPAKWRVPGLV